MNALEYCNFSGKKPVDTKIISIVTCSSNLPTHLFLSSFITLALPQWNTSIITSIPRDCVGEWNNHVELGLWADAFIILAKLKTFRDELYDKSIVQLVRMPARMESDISL